MRVFFCIAITFKNRKGMHNATNVTNVLRHIVTRDDHRQTTLFSSKFCAANVTLGDEGWRMSRNFSTYPGDDQWCVEVRSADQPDPPCNLGRATLQRNQEIVRLRTHDFGSLSVRLFPEYRKKVNDSKRTNSSNFPPPLICTFSLWRILSNYFLLQPKISQLFLNFLLYHSRVSSKNSLPCLLPVLFFSSF